MACAQEEATGEALEYHNQRFVVQAASADHEEAPTRASERGDGHQTLSQASTEASTRPGSPERGLHDSSGALSDEEQQKRYELLEVVGSGVFSTVVLARDKETGEHVAIKQLRMDVLDRCDGMPPQVIREVSLLRGFVHPNIVQLKDIQISSLRECSLVFEYIPDELYRVLKGHRRAGTVLPMDVVRQYSHQLLSGIHACHVRQIIHRDLKPQNILVHPVDGIKICDFGLARICSQRGRTYSKNVITLWYRCPEMLLGQEQYGPEVDMWSAGCILGEMATSRPLFPGDSEIGTIFKILQLLGSPTEASWPGFAARLPHWNDNFPRWPPTDLQAVYEQRQEVGEAGMDLMRGLLAMNPAARLGSRRAKNHAFLVPSFSSI